MIVIALLATLLKVITRIIAIIAAAITLAIIVAYGFLINPINVIRQRVSLLNIR